MKMSGHIAVTAVAVVMGAAGLLYPIQQKINGLETEIASLDDLAPQTNVPLQIKAMHERITEADAVLDERTQALCPDSSAARLQFETALAAELLSSGLQRVSIDRTNGVPIHDIPTFVIEIVVEGTAAELHGFLRGLESLPWVNRVIHLDVHPGLGHRTVEMKIAVPLESES